MGHKSRLSPAVKSFPILDFAVYDIEAAPKFEGEGLNTDFYCADIYDGETHKTVWSVKTLVKQLFGDWLKGKTIFAHYGSRYDLMFILPELMKRGTPAEYIQAGSRVWVFQEDRVIADSFAIIPQGLRKAAEKFKVKTQKGEINFKDIGKPELKKKVVKYCRDDCEALYQIIEAMQEKTWELGGELRLTLASTALTIFRKRFLEDSLLTNPAFHPLERLALYGGRTEVFKKNADRVWYYDINSSYSNSALLPLPSEVYAKKEGAPCELGDSICYVDIDIPESYYPLLPYRAGGKLLFPWGKWRGWYPGPELIECIKLYGESSVKIIRHIEYVMAPHLRDYSLEIYEEKKQGNPAAKLLLNALYGRFAMQEDRQRLVQWPGPEVWERKTKKNEIVTVNQELGIYGLDEKSKSFCWPAVFAFITSRARVQLHRALMASKGRAVYCDTDSVIVEGGPLDIEVGDGLGQWKIESTKDKEGNTVLLAGVPFEAIAPKMYRVGPMYKHKGFRSPEGADPAELFATMEQQQYRLLGLRESMKKGVEKPKLVDIIKKVNMSDDKRIWKNGKSKARKIDND